MTVHFQPMVSPEACPALVLNADFRPFSYYPLSLWSWQDAIKAVFLDRVNIVSNYERIGALPTFEMQLPSVVSLEDLYPAVAPSGLHPLQRVPARSLHLPILRHTRRPDLRPCRPPVQGRHHHLGKRRRGLLAVQPAQGRQALPRCRHVPGGETLSAVDQRPALQRSGSFPPNYLHDSWMDYLYWDSELEP